LKTVNVMSVGYRRMLQNTKGVIDLNWSRKGHTEM